MDMNLLSLIMLNTLRHNYVMLNIVKERTYDDPLEMVVAISAEMIKFGEGTERIVSGRFDEFAKWFLSNTDPTILMKINEASRSVMQEIQTEDQAAD